MINAELKVVIDHSRNWGEPEQAPFQYTKQYGRPWRKNHGENNIATHFYNLVWWFMYKQT